MSILNDHEGVTLRTQLFFVFFVIFCSYFILNLTVAVMLDKFKCLNEY